MNTPSQLPQTPSKPYQLLDKPVTNPKYGGMTLREAVHKILYQPKKKSKIQEVRKS